MKLIHQLFLFCILTLYIFSVQSYSQSTVALTVGNDNNLSSRESATRNLLQSIDYTVELVNYADATYDVLQDYLFTVAVDEGAVTKEVVNQLIESENGIILLYDSGKSFGGSWGSSTAARYRSMLIENGVSFLDGYGSTLSFSMQTSDRAYYIESDYPLGWTILGRNTWRSTAKTTLVREHQSGGRGVILTYDVRHLTDVGENIFLMALEWVVKEPQIPGITVPSGNVAFVIRGSDDTTPVLTDYEEAVRQRLELLGHTITYIRFSRLKNSDLSGSIFVVGVHYPSIDSRTVENLLTNGKGVLLLRASGSSLGGSWGSTTVSGARDLVIENNEAYLEEYTTEMTYNIQREERGYYIDGEHPSDWFIIGRNSHRTWMKTAFYKSSSGNGVILTYNPRYFNEEGEILFERVINWISSDVEMPKIPLLVSPENGSTGLEIELTLEWESSENAENYSLQISDNDNFLHPIIDQKNITDTSYEVSDLEENTTYYWRVRAVNAGLASDWSEMWSFTVGEVTSVLVDLGVPTEYSLFQNYPNPFNPSTTIRYGLPERSHVTLTVYNALGQKITTLVNEEKEASYYEVTFNASNLPSGVYIYQLRAGVYMDTKKFLYLR